MNGGGPIDDILFGHDFFIFKMDSAKSQMGITSRATIRVSF